MVSADYFRMMIFIQYITKLLLNSCNCLLLLKLGSYNQIHATRTDKTCAVKFPNISWSNMSSGFKLLNTIISLQCNTPSSRVCRHTSIFTDVFCFPGVCTWLPIECGVVTSTTFGLCLAQCISWFHTPQLMCGSGRPFHHLEKCSSKTAIFVSCIYSKCSMDKEITVCAVTTFHMNPWVS